MTEVQNRGEERVSDVGTISVLQYSPKTCEPVARLKSCTVYNRRVFAAKEITQRTGRKRRAVHSLTVTVTTSEPVKRSLMRILCSLIPKIHYTRFPVTSA